MSKSDDVEALVEQFQKSGLRELHLRCDELELYLSTDPAGTGIFQGGASHAPPAPADPAVGVAPLQLADPRPHAPASAPLPAREWPADATVVRAPYLGTFYRAPKPGAPAYVEVGARVAPETELCMVEVMKLFTALRAGIRGEVHAVLAEDGQLVHAQQPLFVLVASP